MTTDALPNYARHAPDLPISRFFKWFKPEYTILMAKFVGGVAMGAASGLCGMKSGYYVSGEAFGSIWLPGVSDRVVDRLGDDILAGKSSLSQTRMDQLSTLASYSGSLIGGTAILLSMHAPMLPLNVGLIASNSIFGGLVDVLFKGGRPPRGGAELG